MEEEEEGVGRMEESIMDGCKESATEEDDEGAAIGTSIIPRMESSS